jgi:molybdopterin/thiamine biosynthesis adenylyltransferase
LSQLHNTLLKCGYEYVNAKRLSNATLLKSLDKSTGFYVKKYHTSMGAFELALSFPGDPHIELPHALLLSYPEPLQGRLIPHVNFGNILCYVQEMEADWDPNDLATTYQAVDNQIRTTLIESIAKVEAGDASAAALEGEFGAYWLHEGTVYLLSDLKRSDRLQCRIAKPTDTPEKPNPQSGRFELISSNQQDDEDCQNWLSQRKLKAASSVAFPAHYVRVKPSKLVGEKWPPDNFKSLLKWLSEVDPSARARIAECIAKNQVKTHVILLDVAQQEVVGVFIELNLRALALAQYFSAKTTSKKRKTSVPKISKLAASLSSSRATMAFHRLKVVQTDRNTILSRNRKRPEVGDLRSKQIALVGCGTIGGHIASLLLRGGAGCGSAAFDLFDGDTFSPGNFGRHYLSTSDIDENKSVALAKALTSSTHLAHNINGKGQNFSITTRELEKYDIVLDATGRPPVAKRLASVAREIAGARPILIHGFNDGNGRASKVVVDDGERCYGCMLAEKAFYKDGIDMRFKNIELQGEKRISCGSTYTPYDASVSIITAGMMQEAALNCLEKQFPWTYSEHIFDGSRSKRSRHIPNQAGCKICNAEL